MFPPLLRRALDLDKPVELKSLFEGDPPSAIRILRYCLVETLSTGGAAMDCYVHEDDHAFRTLMWIPSHGPLGTWYEFVPPPFETGLRIMRMLRARTHGKQRQHGYTRGSIRCRWQNAVHKFSVEWPHAWELRIFFGPERPARLPYTLFPTGRILPPEHDIRPRSAYGPWIGSENPPA
jgi:hypothetical protein